MSLTLKREQSAVAALCMLPKSVLFSGRAIEFMEEMMRPSCPVHDFDLKDDCDSCGDARKEIQ